MVFIGSDPTFTRHPITFCTIQFQRLHDSSLYVQVGNVDVSRVATRIGNSSDFLNAIHMLLMTLPGTAFAYYGDELGMHDKTFSAVPINSSFTLVIFQSLIYFREMLYNGFRFVLGYRDWPMEQMASALLNLGGTVSSCQVPIT